MNMPQLHIFSQIYWHTEAFIVGNREGLIALKAAIGKALEEGKGQADAFVSDGEGYMTGVICVDKPDDSREWTLMANPYTDEICSEKRPDAIHAWQLWYNKVPAPENPDSVGGLK